MGFPTTLSSFGAAPVLCELTPEMEYPHLLRWLAGIWSPALKQYGGGAKLIDASGRGNHGTLTSMDPATDWVTSKGYSALDFDGTDDYVSFANPRKLTDTPGFTVCGWFVPTLVDSSWHMLVSKTNLAGGYDREFFVGLNGGFGSPTNGFCFATANALDPPVKGTSAVTANRLYFFFASHRGTTAAANDLYVCSAEGGVEAITSYSGDGNWAIAGTSNNPLQIGKYITAAALPFAGHVLEIAIYDLGLPLSMAEPLYRLGPGGILTPRRRRVYDVAATSASMPAFHRRTRTFSFRG